MASLTRFAACCAAIFSSLTVSAAHIRTALEYGQFTRHQLNVSQAQQELGSQLSPASVIFGPTDPDWKNATERYSTYAPPKIQLVVIPGLESDIPTIVSYLFTIFERIRQLTFATRLPGQMVQSEQSAIYCQESWTLAHRLGWGLHWSPNRHVRLEKHRDSTGWEDGLVSRRNI